MARRKLLVVARSKRSKDRTYEQQKVENWVGDININKASFRTTIEIKGKVGPSKITKSHDSPKWVCI